MVSLPGGFGSAVPGISDDEGLSQDQVTRDLQAQEDTEVSKALDQMLRDMFPQAYANEEAREAARARRAEQYSFPQEMNSRWGGVPADNRSLLNPYAFDFEVQNAMPNNPNNLQNISMPNAFGFEAQEAMPRGQFSTEISSKQAAQPIQTGAYGLPMSQEIGNIRSIRAVQEMAEQAVQQAQADKARAAYNARVGVEDRVAPQLTANNIASFFTSLLSGEDPVATARAIGLAENPSLMGIALGVEPEFSDIGVPEGSVNAAVGIDTNNSSQKAVDDRSFNADVYGAILGKAEPVRGFAAMNNLSGLQMSPNALSFSSIGNPQPIKGEVELDAQPQIKSDDILAEVNAVRAEQEGRLSQVRAEQEAQAAKAAAAQIASFAAPMLGPVISTAVQEVEQASNLANAFAEFANNPQAEANPQASARGLGIDMGFPSLDDAGMPDVGLTTSPGLAPLGMEGVALDDDSSVEASLMSAVDAPSIMGSLASSGIGFGAPAAMGSLDSASFGAIGTPSVSMGADMDAPGMPDNADVANEATGSRGTAPTSSPSLGLASNASVADEATGERGTAPTTGQLGAFAAPGLAPAKSTAGLEVSGVYNTLDDALRAEGYPVTSEPTPVTVNESAALDAAAALGRAAISSALSTPGYGLDVDQAFGPVGRGVQSQDDDTGRAQAELGIDLDNEMGSNVVGLDPAAGYSSAANTAPTSAPSLGQVSNAGIADEATGERGTAPTTGQLGAFAAPGLASMASLDSAAFGAVGTPSVSMGVDMDAPSMPDNASVADEATGSQGTAPTSAPSLGQVSNAGVADEATGAMGTAPTTGQASSPAGFGGFAGANVGTPSGVAGISLGTQTGAPALSSEQKSEAAELSSNPAAMVGTAARSSLSANAAMPSFASAMPSFASLAEPVTTSNQVGVAMEPVTAPLQSSLSPISSNVSNVRTGSLPQANQQRAQQVSRPQVEAGYSKGEVGFGIDPIHGTITGAMSPHTMSSTPQMGQVGMAQQSAAQQGAAQQSSGFGIDPVTGEIGDVEGGGAGGAGGSPKVVCTAMNATYGFGSYRQAIWLEQAANLHPSYQRGYHALAKPMIAYAWSGDTWPRRSVRRAMELAARYRTADIRRQKSGKRFWPGAVVRAVLEPLCFVVGQFVRK